ncbi:uncharacterized protein LOC124444175 isoform X1 [Xenia sp. Carnegie-2017]|uniref:uncharacterized protein LOC124444175 isoform X1 n=1 Tax=Xenia sp. Carnegie-2017 TaxID=2897299 RepID=UPI001F043A8C|nr:uncharacterized protein LOC124444175 isoform X1 [Xenia sp. Carnegie-2017]
MAEWQEVLINLMREKPILYDKSHPDYKDSRNKKRNHCQDVLDEFNKITDLAWDIDTIMKKWANLRDSFMEYNRQYDLRRASGAAATDEPNWKWWRHFDWYLYFNRKRSTSSNLHKRTNAPSPVNKLDVLNTPTTFPAITSAQSSNEPSTSSSLVNSPSLPSPIPSPSPSITTPTSTAPTLAQKTKKACKWKNSMDYDEMLKSIDQQLNHEDKWHGVPSFMR